MPSNWMEEEVLNQGNRNELWSFGRGSRKTMRGRVLRAGERPATATTTYWDVVLYAQGDTEIDYKALGLFPANVLPVRPYIGDVAASGEASYEAGEVIVMSVDVSSGRYDGTVETGTVEEDYCEVFPGSHFVQEGAGSGGCYGSILFGALP